VNLSLAVVDRLGQTVQTGCKSLSRRGLEVGGFLLGRARGRRGSVVVEVEDFEPLECEHAVGPSYLLSANDRQELKKRIRGRKRLSGLSIVGFYRSHTRKEFAVTLEDVDVMAAYFSKPSMVFLLIYAVPNSSLKGAFCIWKKRRICKMEQGLEFPFCSTDLMAGRYELSPRTSPTRWASRKRSFIGGLSFPVLRLPDAGQLLRPWKWAATLMMESRSRVLRLHTNLSSLLPVQTSETVACAVRQLRKRLRTEWVVAEMLAVGMIGGAVYQGSVLGAAVPSTLRVAAQSRGPRSLPDPHRPPTSAAVAGVPSEAAERPSNATASDRGTIAIPKRGSHPQNMAFRAPTLSATSVIPFPPRETAAVSAPLLPDPPAIAVPLESDPEIFSHASSILSSLPPRIPDPLVRVGVDLLPNSHRGRLLGKIPLFHKRRTQAAFLPPTVLHQDSLELPANLRDIQEETVVNVKLYVDRTGTVEYGELLSNETGSNLALSTLAVFSSRRWQFSPARLADDPVPAEVVLHFRFGPKNMNGPRNEARPIRSAWWTA